jgi:hypothetical protein
MAARINRLHFDALGTDSGLDAANSSMAGETTVCMVRVTDDQGQVGNLYWNLSGVAITPTSVTTYDQAPNLKSLFIDPAGGNIYYKAAASTWTALGS